MSSKTDMRALLTRKRQEVVEAIAKLEAKRAVYDDLLDELTNTYTLSSVAVQAVVDTPSVQYHKRAYHKRASGLDRMKALELALEAAGDMGITAKEAAELTSMPVGTASSRLHMLAQEGGVRHVSPRYFAVHSRSQDNNTDQGTD